MKCAACNFNDAIQENEYIRVEFLRLFELESHIVFACPICGTLKTDSVKDKTPTYDYSKHPFMDDGGNLIVSPE